jgi:Ca2+-binding RTX toxin-like protein
MAITTLTVSASHDFTGENLGADPIDQILFQTLSGATATFGSNQFGSGNGLIADNVLITGDTSGNIVEVDLSATGAFSAATFQFAAGWNTSASVHDTVELIGTAGNDTLTGSSQDDLIIGGAGADTLNGGAGGDDTFVLAGAEFASGESIDGGADIDTLLVSGIVNLFAGTLQSIERVTFGDAGFLLLTADQFGSGLISGSLALTGGAFSHGLQVGLLAPGAFSAAGWTFSSWTETDAVIGLLGSNGNDTITGSNKNDVIIGGFGNDTTKGGDGDDVFRYSATGDAGVENVDGGDGADALEISGGNHQFSSVGATLTSIEALRFSGAGSTAATFRSSQVGAGAIAAVTGSAGINAIEIGLDTAVVDLTEVTFASWTAGTDTITINGGFGDDTITGSSQNDLIKGSGGSDALNGGDGDDVFLYEGGTHVGDTEIVDGGSGTDTLEISSGIDDFSSGATLISIEALHFSNGGIATFKGTQVGAGRIAAITGSAFTDEIVVNAASDVDLSALTFSNWTNGDDTITINGTADGETLIGSSQNDTINGGDGSDTTVFSGNRSSYTLTVAGDAIVISGLDGTDTLSSIERLQFADGTIELVNDGSALFDTLFYLNHSPDVFQAGVDPLGHFNTFGFHEGRDPNPFFDTSFYLAVNHDVLVSGANPLDHFHQVGWKEGRDPGPSFDTKLYLIHSPDVAAAGIDPLEHFLQFGQLEGRQAFAAIGTAVNGFDAEFYILHNPDVAAAGVDPLVHYNVAGRFEGRNPNAHFDTAGYLSHYADVAAAGVNPLQHYEQFGWLEGRDPSAGFDTLGYLAANPDVAAAHVNPLDHFLNFGIYEGRTPVNDGVFL